MQQQNSNNTQHNKSFSDILKNHTTHPETLFPKKDQAIIMNAVESLKIKDYIIRIGDIIGPKNILFASKISKNRICVYTSDKSMVEKIVTNYSHIEINGNQINIRKMISPAKRIILSNVCPSIPHSIIEDILKSNGIQLVSPISFLRVGMQETEYSHVLSFRRHVYINENNDIQFPTSVTLNYEETDYRIFLNEETTTCFICKKQGHTSNNCDENGEAQPQSSFEQLENFLTNGNPTTSAKLPPANNLEITEITNATGNKRPAPDSDSSSINNQEKTIEKTQDPPPSETTEHNKDTDGKTPKQTPKKSRSLSPTEALQTSLQQIEKEMEDHPNKYILSFTELKKFLEDGFGVPDQILIARKFTEDTLKLMQMLKALYPFLHDRGLKMRFTKIQNTLNKQLQEEINKNTALTQEETNSS